jgi:hypothetical protein
MDETPLAGGTVTSVSRVGDTVRRTMSRWSPAVHDLLRFLERVGFEGSPRFRGIDEQGREVLTWIEGTPATRPWPMALLTTPGLSSLGEELRRYHDVVADYRPPDDAEWWIGTRPLREGEVVIHGDLGPWNTIWRNERPVAFIDWDFAEPADPLVELAEVAFFATPLRDDAHCLDCGFDSPPDRRSRFESLCAAYGVTNPRTVLDAVERYWELEIHRTITFGAQGIEPWKGFLQRDLPSTEARLLQWVRDNRDMWG